MTYRRYEPELDDHTVRQLFQRKCSREQIALHGDWNPNTIKAVLNRLGLGYPQGRPLKHRDPDAENPKADENKPLMAARSTLGTRLSEGMDCYRLDGVPIRFFDLMREANRVRKEKGMPQFGIEAWRS